MRLIDAKTIEKQARMALAESNPVLMGQLLRYIRKQPTVDAVEVVHGRWESRTDVIGFVHCSVCHDCNIYDEWPDGKKWNYCPNCGAKMDGERKNDDKRTDSTDPA